MPTKKKGDYSGWVGDRTTIGTGSSVPDPSPEKLRLATATAKAIEKKYAGKPLTSIKGKDSTKYHDARTIILARQVNDKIRAKQGLPPRAASKAKPKKA